MLRMTISCLTYDLSVSLYCFNAQAHFSKKEIHYIVLSRTHVKGSSKGGNPGNNLLFSGFGNVMGGEAICHLSGPEKQALQLGNGLCDL